MAKEDVLETALKRFELSMEKCAHNIEKMRSDIRFAAASPDDPWQWDESDMQARGNRPMLTINKMPQHIRQVTNDIRQNRPAIRFRPADDGSDVEVAEILMGLVRHIEANSDADIAYDTASEHQVIHGLGYIRVVADYVSDDSFNQDIFIKRVKDPFKCYDDPNAEDPAGADRKYFFIEDKVSEKEFKEMYPKAEAIDWKFDNDASWFDSEKNVRLVEYFELIDTETDLYMWANGATSFKGDKLPQGVFEGEAPIKTRKAKKRSTMWRKLNGKEILEEREFPCKFIPVARVIGNEWEVDGKTYLSGLVRNAKDSQRMYNVAQSAIVERVMQSPKAPWLAPAEAVEGYEKTWQTANSANHAFLPYNHLDESGNPIPAPQRNSPATVETGLNQIAMGAADDIKSETGQYDASLGQKSNETSGVAIRARQREGDNATFHYVDNLGRAIRHVGRIILDMIPKIYDTERVARILGEDGSGAMATLDPENAEALTEYKDDQGAMQRIFNPNIGTYDVYTSSGPGFSTKRLEAVDAMTAMTQANPQLWQVIGDLLVKNMDWPGADDMAERLKLTLLPQVQQTLDKDKEEQLPPQIQQAMDQMQQQIQAMDQQMQAAGDAIEAKDKELGAMQVKCQQESIKRMSVELDLERVQALGEIKDAQQDLQMQAMQQPAESNGDDAKLAVEQIKAESAERMKLMEIAGQMLTAKPEAEHEQMEPQDQGQNMQDVLMANIAAVQQLAETLAQPRQSSISIVKNPDGSFTGQKIEN